MFKNKQTKKFKTHRQIHIYCISICFCLNTRQLSVNSANDRFKSAALDLECAVVAAQTK